MIVGQMELEDCQTEVLLELASVVREDKGERKRKDRLAQSEEVSGCQRSMRGGGKGKTESGIEVYEGDDIPSGTVDVLLKGIESHHMSWVSSNQSLRLPQGFYASERFDSPCAGDAKWNHPKTAEIDNETANGTNTGSLYSVPYAELLYEWKQLLLAQVRTQVPDASELFEDRWVPDAPALRLGCTTSRVECFQLAATLLQLLLPEIECALLRAICLQSRFKTVLLPECEYDCPLLRCFRDHIAKAYASLSHIQPSLSAAQIASYSHAP